MDKAGSVKASGFFYAGCLTAMILKDAKQYLVIIYSLP